MDTSVRRLPAWLLPSLAAVAVVVALRESFLGMALQWRGSSTYSYGVLIAPIALFLLWRERERLAAVPRAPDFRALLLMVPAGAAWILGILLDANVVHQFAAVALLVLAVWAVLGAAAFRVAWFPLAYLFLMVPVGDALVPTLMKWTADFAVLAVGYSGVPVYQDGFVFSLPSGDFEVIKACSGIRFLMATVAAGTVFAWVAYSSWRKRLLFMLASCIVPVIANLLRAYLVVMVVHLSDGRLAGAHVQYGMVFFGAILFAMFVVGARFADPPPARPDGDAANDARNDRVPGAFMAAALAAVAVLLIAAVPDGLFRGAAHPGALAGQASLPDRIEGYGTRQDGPAGWRPEVFGAASEHLARYASEASPASVDVYVAVYDPADRSGEVTDSRNRVFDSRAWRHAAGSSANGYSETLLRPVAGALEAERASRLVWSWYVVDGQATNTRLEAKALQLRGLLTGMHTPTVMVALSAAAAGDIEAVRGELRAFGRRFCDEATLPCPAWPGS